jgi:hypothetical protein
MRHAEAAAYGSIYRNEYRNEISERGAAQLRDVQKISLQAQMNKKWE